MKRHIFFVFLAGLTVIIITACVQDSSETAVLPTIMATAMAPVAELPTTAATEAPEIATPTAEPSPTALPTVPPTATLAPSTVPPTTTPAPPPALGVPIRVLRSDQTVWFAQGDAVWRSDVHGMEMDRLTGDGFMDPDSPDFDPFVLPGLQISPDGRWLVNHHHKQGLMLVDLPTGQERLRPIWARIIAWSPDSRFLAYIPAEGAPGVLECAVCLYDLAQDDHISLVPHAAAHDNGAKDVWTMSWSPDGERLAYGCCFDPREPYEGVSDGRVEIVTIATGEREQAGPISASAGRGAAYICWTEAGEIITSWGNQGLCADPARATAVLSVENRLAVWTAVYDADDQWTAIRLQVVNLTTRQLVWSELFEGWTTMQLAWSPDGRYLFFDDGQHDSPIWRLTLRSHRLTEIIAAGYLLGVVEQWEAWLPSLMFSPDDNRRVIVQISDPVTVGEDEREQFPSGAKYQVEMYLELTWSGFVLTVVNEWRDSGLGYDYPVPLQWSADGWYIFFANVPVSDGCFVFANGGDLWRFNLRTTELVQLLPFVGMAMALSPDSQTLAYFGAYGRGFHLHNLATGEEIPFDLPDYGGVWQQIGGISWSPDGRQILLIQVLDPCGAQVTAVARLDLDEGEFTTLVEPDERDFRLLNWLNDRKIRLLDKDGRVWYLETNSGEMADRLVFDKDLSEDVLFDWIRQWEALMPTLTVSPDGRWGATAQISDFVYDGDEPELFPSALKSKAELYVAYAQSDLVWEAVNEWRDSGESYHRPTPVHWSSDGRYLYYSNIEVGRGCAAVTDSESDLWRLDLTTGEVEELLPFMRMAVAFSPDSQFIAYYITRMPWPRPHGYEIGFRLRNLTTGEETSLDLSDYVDIDRLIGITWSPDGQHILLAQNRYMCNNSVTTIARLDLSDSSVAIFNFPEGFPEERDYRLLNWLHDQEIRMLDRDGRIWHLDTNSGEITSSP